MDCWYLSAGTEDESAVALCDVGIPVPIPEMRGFLQNMSRKQSLGIDNLTLSDFPRYAQLGDIDHRHLPFLWAEIQRLADRIEDPEDAIDAYRPLPLGIGTNGLRLPLGELWYGDTETLEMFGALDPDIPFIDTNGLGVVAPFLLGVVPDFGVAEAVDAMRRTEADFLKAWLTVEVANDLLHWLSRYVDELTEEMRADIGELPIFRTADGCRPLAEVSLPGGFVDPLGMAELVVRPIAETHGSVLRSLGATELDLHTYISKRLPRNTEVAQADPRLGVRW